MDKKDIMETPMSHVIRDKFLTEAMGECWHEAGTKRVNPFTYVCTKCGGNIKKHSYNNFSTWEGFGKLWEWAIKQDWWTSFDDIHCASMEFPTSLIQPNAFADAIAHYLDGKEVHHGGS